MEATLGPAILEDSVRSSSDTANAERLSRSMSWKLPGGALRRRNVSRIVRFATACSSAVMARCSMGSA